MQRDEDPPERRSYARESTYAASRSQCAPEGGKGARQVQRYEVDGVFLAEAPAFSRLGRVAEENAVQLCGHDPSALTNRAMSGRKRTRRDVKLVRESNGPDASP